jgi:site-specific DNA-methyltransferase (adenine-specific)
MANDATLDKLPIGQLIHGDCLEVMATLPDESIDLIIADPPYFQIKGDFDFQWKTRTDYLDWMREVLLACHRVLKTTGTLILWNSVGQREIMMARLAVMIEDEEIFLRQGWITQRNTRGIGNQRNYMACREDFLFLTKSGNYTFNVPYTEERSTRKDTGANGKPRKNAFKRVSNVWCDITEASQSSIERCNHPTVKAFSLCNRLIQTHSNEGETVFIPFAGSGSEIISARNNHRKVIASEKSDIYCALATERIEHFASAI